MKAVTTVISTVMMAGILIALVGTAYMWGAPLISKRTVMTEFSTAENFLTDLDESIKEIVNTKSGEESLDIPMGFVKVVPHELGDQIGTNNITIELVSDQKMLFEETTVYLGGASFDIIKETGTYGKAEPGIKTLSMEALPSRFKMVLNLHYRELDTNTKGYKIAINDGGQVKTGGKRVIVSYDSTDTIEGAASNGGDLIVTYINVEVV